MESAADSINPTSLDRWIRIRLRELETDLLYAENVILSEPSYVQALSKLEQIFTKMKPSLKYLYEVAPQHMRPEVTKLHKRMEVFKIEGVWADRFQTPMKYWKEKEGPCLLCNEIGEAELCKTCNKWFCQTMMVPSSSRDCKRAACCRAKYGMTDRSENTAEQTKAEFCKQIHQRYRCSDL